MSGAKKTCMRCFTPKPATTTGRLSYEGYRYELDLCEQHGRMFDTDLQNWIRLARDCGPDVKEHVENTVVPFPVTDGGVEYLDDRSAPPEEEISLEAMSYTFSEHAKFRMNHRKVTKTDVFRVISTKNKTVRPSETDLSALVYTTEDLKIVVNPTRKHVITVAFRNEELKELQRSGT